MPGTAENNSQVSGSISTYVTFTILFVLLIVLFVADLSIGSNIYSVKELLSIIKGGGTELDRTIFTSFRLPRALTAVFAGIALSVSGLQMQTVFRNPLAGPYVLGISSGASLGVAILILGLSSVVSFSGISLTGNWALVIASWTGAGLVLLLIMFVASRVRDIMTVLILGIMLGSAISAFVSILQYFSNESMLKAFVIWTMGSLGNLSWSQLNVLMLSVLAGLIISIVSVKRLDALMLGEDYARTIGLRITSTRFIVFIGTAILAGSVTAFCGPISFLGIAVPHITRLFIGKSSHKYLIPGTVLIGSILLLISDIISQMPGSDRVLPINSVTALIGIPVMIWIILRRNKMISVG
jgi:iron complex transport system permease protein